MPDDQRDQLAFDIARSLRDEAAREGIEGETLYTVVRLLLGTIRRRGFTDSQIRWVLDVRQDHTDRHGG